MKSRNNAMLKKIISVRNVGRFVNSALPGAPAYAKYTQLYGANGYGKTTLCSILRSAATNDSTIVIGRARVGGRMPGRLGRITTKRAAVGLSPICATKTASCAARPKWLWEL